MDEVSTGDSTSGKDLESASGTGPAIAADVDRMDSESLGASEGSAGEGSAGKVNGSAEKNPNLKWYVVHAYSGFELKAKSTLEERIRMHHMENFFGEVHVPQETVVELVRGQKKTSSRKFYPGYMLVQMVLNEDTWHLVKETPKITGFIGDAKEPQPLTEEEISRVMTQVEEGAQAPKAKMSFSQGESVKVIDGPFADFNGVVEEVRPEKGKVKVLITIFGRATPLELDFIQVEKI